jgi:hypothetical protein
MSVLGQAFNYNKPKQEKRIIKSQENHPVNAGDVISLERSSNTKS